jgi:hypothetical protein
MAEPIGDQQYCDNIRNATANMTWSAGTIDPLHGTHQYDQTLFSALEPHRPKNLTGEFFRKHLKFTAQQLKALSSDVQDLFTLFPVNDWADNDVKPEHALDTMRDVLLPRWKSALNVPNEFCATGLDMKDGLFAVFIRKYVGYRKTEEKRKVRTGSGPPSSAITTPMNNATTTSQGSTTVSHPTTQLPDTSTVPRSSTTPSAQMLSTKTVSQRATNSSTQRQEAVPTTNTKSYLVSTNPIPLKSMYLFVTRGLQSDDIYFMSENCITKRVGAFDREDPECPPDDEEVVKWVEESELGMNSTTEQLLLGDCGRWTGWPVRSQGLIGLALVERHRLNESTLEMSIHPITATEKRTADEPIASNKAKMVRLGTADLPIDLTRTIPSANPNRNTRSASEPVSSKNKGLKIPGYSTPNIEPNKPIPQNGLSPISDDDFFGGDQDDSNNQSGASREIGSSRFTRAAFFEACDIFQISPPDKMSARKLKVKYIRGELYPHQIMFLAYAMEHYSILGVLWLEDKQGLGKTKQGIMLAWLNLVLNIMRQSCRLFWHNGTGHRHLAKDETNLGARCPSSAHWPFRCYCEPDSPTRRWLPRVGPSLVVCLAGSVISKWCSEIDTLAEHDSPFKLQSIFAHGTVKLRPASALLFDNHSKARQFDQKVSRNNFACTPDGSWHRNLDLDKYIIVTTEKSAETQVFKMVNAQLPSHVGIPFKFVMIDEAHKRTNSDTAVNRQVLRRLSWRDDFGKTTKDPHGKIIFHSRIEPTMFLMLTGTPWRTPDDLETYWYLINYQARGIEAARNKYKLPEWTPDDRWNKLVFETDLQKFVDLFNKSVGNNAVLSAGKEFARVWQLVSIGRNDSTVIDEEPFNEPIITMPALHRHVESVTYLPALLEVANAEFGMLLKELKRRKTISSFAAFENAFSIDNKTAQVVGSLPSIVYMIAEGVFDKWRYNDSDEEAKARNSKAVLESRGDLYKPPRIKLTQARLRFNRFHEDAKLIGEVVSRCEKDPKIVWLKGIINNIIRGGKFYDQKGQLYDLKGDEQCMREARERAKDDDAGFFGKPEEHVEKMLVLVQQTFTAYVVAEFIRREFPNDKVATITGLLENSQRDDIVKRYQDMVNDDHDDPEFVHPFSERPRIIVATVAQVAEGIDLYRGNHTIFFEQGSHISQEQQAAKRQHRIGQTRPCHVYRCLVPGLQIEEIMRDRNARMELFAQAAREAEEEETNEQTEDEA